MRLLRLLNPFRHARLERENAALRRQRAADGEHIKSHVESIGRQAEPGELTELRGQVALLWNSLDIMASMVRAAKDDLICGNPHKALHKLIDILDAVTEQEQREAS